MYEILNDRSIIRVYGNNCLIFLNNLTTNDLKTNNFCYTYAINNQGQYLFDFFVYKLNENEFYIDINKNQIDDFKKYLNFFNIRKKISVSDESDNYFVIYSKNHILENSLYFFQDPRFNLLGYRGIINKKLNFLNSKSKLYLQDKYNFAIIDGYEDLIYMKSIPVEYGCDQLNAVSYTKGCYVGQEVISRVKYQGVVRKKIYKASFASNGQDICKNDAIFADEVKIGNICSVYDNVAIALVREEDYSLNQQAGFKVKGINVFLSQPPWRN